MRSAGRSPSAPPYSVVMHRVRRDPLRFARVPALLAVLFPIALAAAGQLGVDPAPFIMTVAIGSACAFAFPISYQTHLIVYGAGAHRFGDFLRIGIPLDLVCMAVALTAIPRIWPFH